MRLYSPPDLLQAHEEWKATCGPGALAAVLGVPLVELKGHFLRARKKPSLSYTTPTMMQQVLHALGRTAITHQGWANDVHFGLAFIQLRGTWDNAPERVQYKHSHWVGFARVGPSRLLQLYDVNAGEAGEWEPSWMWKEGTIRNICEQHEGASGLWRVRLTLEVLGEASGQPGGALAETPPSCRCGNRKSKCRACGTWWCTAPGHLRHRCDPGWPRCKHGEPYWEGTGGRQWPPDCCLTKEYLSEVLR